MKPDFFQIKKGCYKIGINQFISGMDNKPVVRVECVNDYTHAQDIDDEWIDEQICAMFTFRNIDDYDLFIQKLQDARSFLLHER